MIMINRRHILKNRDLNRVQLAMIFLIFLTGCYTEESLDIPVSDSNANLTDDLDLFIENNFTNEYGMAIRYRFVDRYVDPTTRVTPPRLTVVEPMLNFINDFWIDPYESIENGEEFFREHVPAEIILLGGFIYNGDGTVTLGTADAGARITFTNVNAVDITDEDWRTLQLQTVYHEFAHTVHQRYKLPTAFETISPTGYTSGGSWFNLLEEEALRRGFVSPYATSSPNEDFAETISFFLFDPNFYETYINEDEDCITADCVNANEGRDKLSQKISAITQHYQKVVDIDINELREVIQTKIADLE